MSPFQQRRIHRKKMSEIRKQASNSPIPANQDAKHWLQNDEHNDAYSETGIDSQSEHLSDNSSVDQEVYSGDDCDQTEQSECESGTGHDQTVTGDNSEEEYLGVTTRSRTAKRASKTSTDELADKSPTEAKDKRKQSKSAGSRKSPKTARIDCATKATGRSGRKRSEPIAKISYQRQKRKEKISVKLFPLSMKCPMDPCDQFFCDQTTLDLHLSLKHQTNPHRCLVGGCGLSFVDKDELHRHRLAIHTGFDSVPCAKCDKLFTTYEELASHVWMYHEMVKFVCPRPGCEFKESSTTRRVVQSHRYRHAPAKYQCDVAECSFTTKTPFALDQHKRVHTGERPFPCPKCQYAAQTSTSLKSHMNRHSIVMQYRCKYTYEESQCDDLFKSLSGAIGHVRVSHFDLPRRPISGEDRERSNDHIKREYIEKIADIPVNS